MQIVIYITLFTYTYRILYLQIYTNKEIEVHIVIFMESIPYIYTQSTIPPCKWNISTIFL